jgi:prepilin-type processing-associated H-X9-DG protein
MTTTLARFLPPPTEFGRNGYFAHYGIAKPSIPTNRCGTQQSSYSAYPGSGWASSDTVFVNRNFSEVVNSARTALTGDGYSAVLKDRTAVRVAFGCEATFRHKGEGGNFAFVDGHSKYFPTNPEHGILEQDENGCYYRKYFTFDK